MSNNSENKGKNVNKITILNISGKKKDREEFIEVVNKFWYTKLYKTFQYSSRQIVRKIQAYEHQHNPFPDILLFENLNSNIVQNIGDELGNMIIDIHLNKVNKCIKNQQIKDILELLEKL